MRSIYILFCIAYLGLIHSTKALEIQNLKHNLSLRQTTPLGAQVVPVLSEENPPSSQFVAVLPNGVVVNEGGILTQEGYIVEDTQTSTRDQHRLKNKNRDLNAENPLFFMGRLAVIASAGSENWYHWLLQALPRLMILKASGLDFDRIYVNNLKYSWQEASLRLVLDYLRIDTAKVLAVNGDVVLQADTLLVPSVPFIPVKGTPLPNWLVQDLRGIFLASGSLPAPETFDRIYISRQHAGLRRIENETALIELLTGFGFQAVELETLSPQQQAALFHNARYIVGPHGSGFANLVFTQPGYTLIEIDHGCEPQRSFYKRLAELTQGLYAPFYVDHTSEDHLEDDMTVDLERFKVFLQRHLK